MGDVATTYKSPLHEMTQTTRTCLWNDSCSLQELGYAIEHGAVGATCNPVIVADVLKREMHLWKDRIQELTQAMPTAAEHDIAWRVVDEMTIAGAALLKPVFDAQQGRNGRLSVQTDPRFYRDTEAILHQADHFAGLAPNIIVKIPVTAAGIPGNRGGDLPRHQHQCHRLFFAAAVRRRGGGGRARPSPPRAGGQRHRDHGAGLHHHGRAGSTTGSRSSPRSSRSASIPACSSGPASRCSRRPTGCSRNAVTGSVCSRRRSGTTCTGASWSAATSSSRRRTCGRNASTARDPRRAAD